MHADVSLRREHLRGTRRARRVVSRRQDTHALSSIRPPGTDLDNAVVEAVRLRHLVEFRGSESDPVAHITLRGITFTHAARTFMDNREPLLRSDWTIYRGGAVLFDGAEDCRIEKCLIDQARRQRGLLQQLQPQLRGRRAAAFRTSAAMAFASSATRRRLRSPLFEYGQTAGLSTRWTRARAQERTTIRPTAWSRIA